MSGSLLERALRLNPQLQPFDARPVKRVGDNRACPWPMGHGRSSHHQTKGLRPGRSGDDLGRNPDDLKLGPWDFQGGVQFSEAVLGADGELRHAESVVFLPDWWLFTTPGWMHVVCAGLTQLYLLLLSPYLSLSPSSLYPLTILSPSVCDLSIYLHYIYFPRYLSDSLSVRILFGSKVMTSCATKRH